MLGREVYLRKGVFFMVRGGVGWGISKFSAGGGTPPSPQYGKPQCTWFNFEMILSLVNLIEFEHFFPQKSNCLSELNSHKTLLSPQIFLYKYYWVTESLNLSSDKTTISDWNFKKRIKGLSLWNKERKF